MGANERLLEVRMCDRFLRRRETGAELRARRAHFQIGQDRIAPAQAAGDKNRDIAKVGQNFLRQDSQ